MSKHPESVATGSASKETNLDKNSISSNRLQDQSQLEDTTPNSQPVSIKAWAQKLLVIALCAMSFYAGWQANKSSLVRQCLESGGSMDAEAPVLSCQWP
jgi:hypothetical protein